MSAEFCDTNVLVYAYDLTASLKRERARALLERLWATRDGVLSVQVLQELFVTLTRKLDRPLSAEQARATVADLATWQVVSPTAYDVLAAIDGAIRWQVSFWDAMILTAAQKAEASVVWSEDLNHGQVYNGTVVRNPFLAPSQR
jgi:predicted nucleic acid-binding protein